MERTCRDEEDVIGLYGTVLRHHRRALDNRQDIALHTFARDVRARTAPIADGDLVDLIEEDDAAVLGGAHRFLRNSVHIDELVRLLRCKDLAGLIDCDLALAAVFRNEFADHGLEVVTHALKR